MKSRYLGIATGVLALATGLAGVATAQVTTNIYDGGNTLFAPYLRQSEDCYGNPTALVIQGSNTHSPTTKTITAFNYLGTPAFNCASQHVDSTTQLNTIQAGSGTNIKAVFSHDPVTFWGDTVPPGNNNTPYPTVNWGASETPLAATDVAVYNNGGVEQGITFTATPGPGQYPIPQPLYGNLIQYPMLIAPLAIAYDAVYKKVRNADGSITAYHFNVAKPRSDGSGGLVLDAATYCAIFNGQITDWNQIPTSLNGGKSLQDPSDTGTFSVPLVMVGRSDSAGATSTFTRHLAAQCVSPVYGGANAYADSTTTLPASLVAANWNKANPNYGSASGVTDVPGKFTDASGADGVADYIQFDPNNVPGLTAGDFVVQGRIGYDGNDNVLPYVAVTGNNGFGLNSANLLRPGGKFSIAPTAKTASLAYGASIKPPTGANATLPSNWVQAPSKSAPIAIPANVQAYPFVGTSNFLGYTCYSAANVAKNLTAFLYWYETSKVVEDATRGVLQASGSAPMPLAWQKAIAGTFLKPSAGAKPLNLYILQAGTGPASGTGSQCKAITPGG